MREIEIKARISDKAGLLARLADKGIRVSQPLKQHDIVYGEKNDSERGWGYHWLRVRIENDSKAIFTYKRSVTGELDSIEHEVIVDSSEEMISIIQEIGYELYSDLTKYRQKAKHGEYEICVDEIEGLGSFIEIEKICEPSADVQAVQVELWDFLKELGVSRADEETSGYDVLMRIKEGKGRY